MPPNIDDSLSSSDVIVREGANISLRCRATGSPSPTIKWKRDDGSKISINKSLSGNLIQMNIKINLKWKQGIKTYSIILNNKINNLPFVYFHPLTKIMAYIYIQQLNGMETHWI